MTFDQKQIHKFHIDKPKTLRNTSVEHNMLEVVGLMG